MSLKRTLLLATIGVAWCASESRAQFISEQNGDGNLYAASAIITGSTLGEFVEFVNNSGSPFSLNSVSFSDSGQTAATFASITSGIGYDFAFKTTDSPTMAPGQALAIISRGTLNTNVVPRNLGGSMIFQKANAANPFTEFSPTTVPLPNGSGAFRTGSPIAADGAVDFGISTSAADVMAAYLGRAATDSVVFGPWVSGAGASGNRTGDAPAGAAILHPTLGSSASSLGIKSDGTSWVTPEQVVSKIAGDGTVTGANNAWTVDFGTVNVGTPLTVTLALGNSAGLGGVLRAVGDASATGNVTITTGASQTLSLLGGESTNNYGALGTINGFNYSDGASASNLTFTLDTSTAGLLGGTYSFNVRDGFSILNGDAASPLLEGGQLTISFTADVTAIPEPSTMVLGSLGLLGLAGYGLRRRRASQAS